MVKKNLLEDAEKWERILGTGERGGLQMSAADCYHVGLVLECLRQKIMDLQTMLDIERRTLDGLDPDGSRRRMGLQRAYGATPYESRARSSEGWDTTTERETWKPTLF